MDRQVVQLLMEHKETGDNRNVHRQVTEYSVLPAEVNGEQLHLSSGTATLFTLAYQGREVLLTPEQGGNVAVNGSPVDKAVLLKNGDRLQIAGKEYLFYVRILDTKLSFSSKLLARLAAAIILVFVVLELCLMFGGPWVRKQRSMWDKASNREKLQIKMAVIQARIQHIKADTSFEQTILKEFSHEVEQMQIYMQANEHTMRNRTRRAINDRLSRMLHLLDAIEMEGAFGKPEPWDAEQAVKQVISGK